MAFSMQPCGVRFSSLDLSKVTGGCLSRPDRLGTKFRGCFLMKLSFLVVRAYHLFHSRCSMAFFRIFLRDVSQEINTTRLRTSQQLRPKAAPLLFLYSGPG